MGNLLTRTITGAGIVVVIAGSLLLHPLSMVLLGVVIVWGSISEFSRMILKNNLPLINLCMIISGLVAYFLSFLVAAGLIDDNYYFLLLLLPLAFIGLVIARYGKLSFGEAAIALSGVIYLTMAPILMLIMSLNTGGIAPLIESNSLVYSPSVIMGFFILLWINDTGAYLVGSAIGRHNLARKISPKKSWEGFIGGFGFSLVASLFMQGIIGGPERIQWVCISVITSLGGTIGDLIESALKREAGVKDSGKILPGHGGFLDRFDGFFFALPLVFILIFLFG